MKQKMWEPDKILAVTLMVMAQMALTFWLLF